jgi:hypothetical protein
MVGTAGPSRPPLSSGMHTVCWASGPYRGKIFMVWGTQRITSQADCFTPHLRQPPVSFPCFCSEMNYEVDTAFWGSHQMSCPQSFRSLRPVTARLGENIHPVKTS